jgi:hypothetical protein
MNTYPTESKTSSLLHCGRKHLGIGRSLGRALELSRQ